ncbi:MAG: ChbG/HpnK family deacetylase [Verrucomicrobiota bacterium]
MAKEVIFVADDFGMSPAINDAILHAHVSGQLQAASLMMAQPATAEAVDLARAHPSLQIGWHLHLNDSVPATVDHWPWGRSPAAAGLAIGLSPRARALMRREVARQWELFQRTGLECRFINSHHHLHAHPFVYRALRETIGETVGSRFEGWIRLGLPREAGGGTHAALWAALSALYLNRRRRLSAWRSTDTLWGVRTRLTAARVRAAIATLPGGFHEFLFHPRTRSCSDTLCLLQLKSSSPPA